ncbi:MAG TPA: hypothetical protein VFO62_03585, partial [Candidatus Binatia bacterium]|nr:hypothetical protein [Candidatus Binatia bacterium]
GGYLLPFSRSTDDARTFSALEFVVPGSEYVSFGQIRLASGGPGDLQAVFTSFDTYFGGAEIVHVASSDGGDTFPNPRVISTIDYLNSYVADVGVGWGVAAAWANTDLATESTVDLSVSEDAGATFSTPKRVDTPGGYRSSPVVGLHGDSEVYVAWVGNDDPLGASDAEEIYFSRSTDRGVTFFSPINVSSNSEKSWPPRMAVDGAGTIYLVWAEGDFTVDEKLLFAVSVDGGASFSEPRVLAGPTAWVEGRIVAVGDGVIWVAWNAAASVSEPGHESYVMRSVDGGLAFSPPTPLPGLSEIASASSERFFVAWSETPDGEEWPEVLVARGEIFTCGDADVDGRVTATDALVALQAGVGAAECAECRCDVNSAGGISATDALLILRAAVGEPITLICPSC